VSEAEQNGNGTKNGVKSSEKEVECLTVDEELKIVGYYCLQAMKFATHMNFPTEVKVRWIMSFPITGLMLFTGNGSAVSETVLSYEFPHDISSQGDYEVRSIPCHQDGKPLHSSQKLCVAATQNHS
jgi:hypothetical protein